jgi:hypothetical protein
MSSSPLWKRVRVSVIKRTGHDPQVSLRNERTISLNSSARVQIRP